MRDNVVTVVEKWESLDALEAHLIAPRMMQFRQQTQQLRAATSLQIVEPA